MLKNRQQQKNNNVSFPFVIFHSAISNNSKDGVKITVHGRDLTKILILYTVIRMNFEGVSIGLLDQRCILKMRHVFH